MTQHRIYFLIIMWNAERFLGRTVSKAFGVRAKSKCHNLKIGDLYTLVIVHNVYIIIVPYILYALS